MVPVAREGVEVRVYWGTPHSGKTHAAVEWLGEGYYDKLSMNKWWDGYQGEECVLIDDFDSQIGYTHLKRWFDKYKCSVETKGGAVPLRATKIAVTSNIDPKLWWPEAD